LTDDHAQPPYDSIPATSTMSNTSTHSSIYQTPPAATTTAITTSTYDNDITSPSTSQSIQLNPLLVSRKRSADGYQKNNKCGEFTLIKDTLYYILILLEVNYIELIIFFYFTIHLI